MVNLNLISDYKHIEKYRKSFNELAMETFNISFEKWYSRGFWDDNYICYSYIHNDKVVANVSINKMDIVLQGQRKKAIQIGTVMTHKDYRNKGLSRNLINLVLEKYEKQYHFIYLFANDSVLDFYPKFGFTKLKESEFSIKVNISKDKCNKIRKLSMSNSEDLDIILRLGGEATPVSKDLAVLNHKHLLLFYCLYVFGDDIYYIEDKDIIVLYKQSEDTLHIFDIISKEEVLFNDIISRIASREVKKVVFGFTPDFKDIDSSVVSSICKGDTLFIKPMVIDSRKKFMFPIISHA